jgi:hypothetical protein
VVLRANLLTISTLVCAIAACALAARASARSRIDEIDYSQRYALAIPKRAVVDFIDITIDFRQNKLTLYHHNIIYGSHDSGMDANRIHRTATLSPQIEHQIMDAMYTAHAFDLGSDPTPRQPATTPWWCTVLWSPKHQLPRSPVQDPAIETFSFIESGKPKHTAVFTKGLGLDGKLLIRKSMISVLKQLKIDMTPKPDELVTEEGDQFEPIKTNLKDVLDHSDNYRGKRVSVTGWPVADGRELIGLSLQKSTPAGKSKYLAIDHYVSCFANESDIKPDINSRLTVDGIIASWCDPAHPQLVRATRIEPAPAGK